MSLTCAFEASISHSSSSLTVCEDVNKAIHLLRVPQQRTIMQHFSTQKMMRVPSSLPKRHEDASKHLLQTSKGQRQKKTILSYSSLQSASVHSSTRIWRIWSLPKQLEDASEDLVQGKPSSSCEGKRELAILSCNDDVRGGGSIQHFSGHLGRSELADRCDYNNPSIQENGAGWNEFVLSKEFWPDYMLARINMEYLGKRESFKEVINLTELETLRRKCGLPEWPK